MGRIQVSNQRGQNCYQGKSVQLYSVLFWIFPMQSYLSNYCCMSCTLGELICWHRACRRRCCQKSLPRPYSYQCWFLHFPLTNYDFNSRQISLWMANFFNFHWTRFSIYLWLAFYKLAYKLRCLY